MIGVCEGIHRSGRVDERLARVLRAGGDTPQLRALIAEPVVVELVALVDRFRDVLPAIRQITGAPGPGRPSESAGDRRPFGQRRAVSLRRRLV